jgi:hypothetical protein
MIKDHPKLIKKKDHQKYFRKIKIKTKSQFYFILQK